MHEPTQHQPLRHPASPLPQRRPVSLPRLAQLREAGKKITMLTAYDATFAATSPWCDRPNRWVT